MPNIARSSATLRIFGDHLNREEITKTLGCEPTEDIQNGYKIEGRTRESKVLPTRTWQLQITDRAPAHIDDQIDELLNLTSADPAVWRELASKYDVDLFCGLFANGLSQQDLLISARSLLALGERGIDISFDIYLSDDNKE
jgi:hypothetical protein